MTDHTIFLSCLNYSPPPPPPTPLVNSFAFCLLYANYVKRQPTPPLKQNGSSRSLFVCRYLINRDVDIISSPNPKYVFFVWALLVMTKIKERKKIYFWFAPSTSALCGATITPRIARMKIELLRQTSKQDDKIKEPILPKMTVRWIDLTDTF